MSRILLIVVLLFVVATPVMAETELACCTEPGYGSANIDGNPTEWVSDPIWGYLRLGWDKQVLASVKLRYDCSTERLFLHIEAVDGREIQDEGEEIYIKNESSALPWEAFKWTDTEYHSFEAAVAWPRGWNTITIHINVIVDGVTETAGLQKACISITCQPTAVTLRDAGVWSDGNGIHPWWWTASEVGTIFYQVWRTNSTGFLNQKLVATVPVENFGMGGALYNKTVQRPSQNRSWHYWLVEYSHTGAAEPVYLGTGNWNREMPWVQSLGVFPWKDRKVRLAVTARDRQANMVNVYTMIGDHPEAGALVMYNLPSNRFLLNNLTGGWVGMVAPGERVVLTNPLAKLFGVNGRVATTLEGKRMLVSQVIQMPFGQWPVWVWVEDSTGQTSEPALLGLVNIN